MLVLSRGWGWRNSYIRHYCHDENEFKVEVITFIVSTTSQRKMKKRDKETDGERQKVYTSAIHFLLRLILKIINSPWQQFSDHSVHQHYPEGLLNHQLLGPTHRVSNLIGTGWGQEFVFGQVLDDADILIKGPHFENHWSIIASIVEWLLYLLKWNRPI